MCCISSAIQLGFPLSKISQNIYISPMKFYYDTSSYLPKSPKDLDPSYKMDLKFWDCFGRK